MKTTKEMLIEICENEAAKNEDIASAAELYDYTLAYDCGFKATEEECDEAFEEYLK
jgi:hypothetical protein